MYVHKKTLKNGSHYYSFTYIDDTGKRVRLKKSEHPHFTDETEAKAWAKSQEAYRASRKAYIDRKLAWRTTYYQFDHLLERYARWQADKAPNSWTNNVKYLEGHVFPFFLNEKQASNINTWHLLFQEYVDWLQHENKVGKDQRPMSLASANNAIRTLNTFLTCLAQYNLIDPDSAKKCPTFPEHRLNSRGAEHVISEAEMNFIYSRMLQIHEPAAEFFYVLWHTGMRFSELFGLPITSIFKGELTTKSLHDSLQLHGITYVGYIYLDSQPKTDDRRRDSDGSLPRKPLKGRREINPKNARVIPITSKNVWNILAKRYKTQADLYTNRHYTSKKQDYVFFDDLEWNRAVNTLREAYLTAGMKPKSYHCCRHSFVTQLVGRTQNPVLVRQITGHKKDKSFERYLHIYEQVAIEAQQATQEIDEIA